MYACRIPICRASQQVKLSIPQMRTKWENTGGVSKFPTNVSRESKVYNAYLRSQGFASGGVQFTFNARRICKVFRSRSAQSNKIFQFCQEKDTHVIHGVRTRF